MAASLPQRLHDAALRCCQEEGTDDSLEFLDLLESPLHDLALKRSAASTCLAQCEQLLQQTAGLLDPLTSSGLVLCEKIGLELPKVVVKFVSLSQGCQDHCITIIEVLAENSNPREMFAAFMEALNMYTTSQTLIYCIPLLQGLSSVFSRLQRRQAQFFQEASSGLLALVRLAVEDEGDDQEEEEIAVETVQQIDRPRIVLLEEVRAAIVDNIVQVAQAVRETCDVMAETQCGDLQQSLGTFALQILGIAGEKIAHPGREVPSSVVELVELLPCCGLSVSRLFTGDQLESLFETTADDVTDSVDEKALANINKLEATKGAALAVYWTLFNNQVAEAADVSRNSLKDCLQFTGSRELVAAVCVATSLLSGPVPNSISSVPATGLTLINTILELTSSLESSTDGKEEEYPGLMLRILPALQTLQNVVVYALSIEMRRQAYATLKRVIQGVLPETTRIQCLQTLIKKTYYVPSLVSLHLIFIKDEVARAWPTGCQQQSEASSAVHTREGQQAKDVVSQFVSEKVLEVVGSVLRPGKGVPPDLPAQIDPVRSALNLYRFILIRESSGKTNYTGVLSKEVLTKARSQWLLPLRDLVRGVSLGLVVKDDEISADMGLALDNLQSVLYRCLELNEDALSHL